MGFARFSGMIGAARNAGQCVPVVVSLSRCLRRRSIALTRHGRAAAVRNNTTNVPASISDRTISDGITWLGSARIEYTTAAPSNAARLVSLKAVRESCFLVGNGMYRTDQPSRFRLLLPG